MRTGSAFVFGRCASIFLLIMTVTGSVWTRQAGAAPVQARSAYDFVNSVGVCTHFGYADTVYRTQYAELKSALAELGIKHIREEIGNAATMPFYRDLYTTLSVKLTSVLTPWQGSGATLRLATQDIGNILDRVKSLTGAEALAALEETNEFNLLERDFAYPAWPQDLRFYQLRFYQAVKADPELSYLPVLAPALGGPLAGTYYAKLGDISPIIDAGSAHIYPNRQSFAQAVAEGVAEARIAAPTGRIWVTETGWHNATNSGALFVDDDIQAKYVARAMVEFSSNRDLERGFFYQLVDYRSDPLRQAMNSQFGLLGNNLLRKPKFYAIRNMMRLMCDSRYEGTPGALDLDLSGNLQNIRHALYQKTSGIFLLSIWLEKQSFGADGKPIINPPQPVTIAFNQSIAAVRTYLPSDPSRDLTLGDQPVATMHYPSRLNLMVEDHVIILEIVPREIPLPAVSTACTFTPS